jgi:1-deoxy-D-xylulose-5-phosphate reductoisomerase
MAAVVGLVGLALVLSALRHDKKVALANKETMVVAGPLVNELLRKGDGQLLPVDSEHSAIFQCLAGESESSVEEVVLTASGGPFHDRPRDTFESITVTEALDHPNWSMGPKITIDSATMMNKGLEVIEARWLFGLPPERIEVVIHRQSVVHSLVEFVDGSVLAQIGFPTMELPILYALTYPERVEDAALQTYDPVESSPLTFEDVDREGFPLFGLGVEAGRSGGTAPAVFNAANEVAVEAFLDGGIGFPEMAEVVEGTLETLAPVPIESIDGVREADARARDVAGDRVRALIASRQPNA